MTWAWQPLTPAAQLQSGAGPTFVSAWASGCNSIIGSKMKKNVAGQKIGIQMVSATDGSAFTGAVTIYVTGDAGVQAVGSVGAGACTHEGNGYHTYAPAQAETNYDLIGFTFTGSGAVPSTVQVFTSFPQTGDAFVTATAIEVDTQDIQSRLPAALVSGRIDASVGAMAANTLTASALATDAIEEIADQVWDEPLTGATHNVATSAGRRLREASSGIVSSGTAQAGTVNTITLAAGESAVDGAYDPSMVLIVGGTGFGQQRLVLNYNGTTKVAVVDRDWAVTPDATSEYEILAAFNLTSTNEGLAQGGGATTITLNNNASSIDDTYNGQLVVIRTGTGQDQSRLIVDYNGTTKVATISEAWVTNPTTASGYMIWPTGRGLTDKISTDAIAQINAEVDTAITDAALATAANLALVKAKTDSLTFTVAGQVDANAVSMNDTEILGTGAAGDLWRG